MADVMTFVAPLRRGASERAGPATNPGAVSERVGPTTRSHATAQYVLQEVMLKSVVVMDYPPDPSSLRKEELYSLIDAVVDRADSSPRLVILKVSTTLNATFQRILPRLASSGPIT